MSRLSLTSSDLPATSHEFSRAHASTPARPAAPIPFADPSSEAASGIVADRWPLLARAMGQYARGVAESFSAAAYDRVEEGLIRLDHRRTLSAQAARLNIRPFDAQLLIACAIRKWALDHQFDSAPSTSAPKLSPEYRPWRTMWLRLTLAASFILCLEGLFAWKWLTH